MYGLAVGGSELLVVLPLDVLCDEHGHVFDQFFEVLSRPFTLVPRRGVLTTPPTRQPPRPCLWLTASHRCHLPLACDNR